MFTMLIKKIALQFGATMKIGRNIVMYRNTLHRYLVLMSLSSLHNFMPVILFISFNVTLILTRK